MFKKVKNILTGTNKKWADTNNVVINHFWSESEKLNDLYKTIAQEFIVASLTVSNYLLGPNRNKMTFEKISQKEINQLTVTDFYNFHIRLLAIFYSMFIENNSYNSGNIFESLSVLIDHKIEPILIDDEIPSEKKNEEIIKIGIKDISNNLDFINSVDPIYYYSMTTLIMTIYIEFMKNINEKLKG